MPERHHRVPCSDADIRQRPVRMLFIGQLTAITWPQSSICLCLSDRSASRLGHQCCVHQRPWSERLEVFGKLVIEEGSASVVYICLLCFLCLLADQATVSPAGIVARI